MRRQIRVAEYHLTCATRERGAKFYPVLLRQIDAAPSWGEVVLDFGDVEFVSPSFLDETVVRLASERPELASRVLIRGLSDFSAKRLRVVLGRRHLDWTLRTLDAGEYRLEG